MLFAAVGRRLGYPLKLVTTARHLFARWDDPFGERFNIEINETGLNTHPDEHYLTWPVDIRGTKWQTETKFLRSLTPREEVAHAWAKRGHNLRANGRLKEAVDCFATACSIVTDDRLLDLCLWGLLKQRRAALKRRIPAVTPKLRIYFPPQRRYPGLPIEMERDVIALEVLEGLLDEPIPMWTVDPLRRPLGGDSHVIRPDRRPLDHRRSDRLRGRGREPLPLCRQQPDQLDRPERTSGQADAVTRHGTAAATDERPEVLTALPDHARDTGEYQPVEPEPVYQGPV